MSEIFEKTAKYLNRENNGDKAPTKVLVPASLEPFVDKNVAAIFAAIPPAEILRLVRKKVIRGYPIGNIRKRRRFRLSELAEDIQALAKNDPGTISQAAPVSQRRNSYG